MVSTTETLRNEGRYLPNTARPKRTAVACLVCGALLAIAAVTGCTSGITPPDTGSVEETKAVGARMGGPVIDVNVTQQAIDAKPAAWDLSTPEKAVRSYLDWTSYAYRIGQSSAAKATMTSYEEVRVDSYVQLNLQKYRLIDQRLDTVEFGKVSTEGTRAILPAKEEWKYRYVSVKTAGKTDSGPFSASYETTYTVVKNASGDWVVDSVEAKALGTVK